VGGITGRQLTSSACVSMQDAKERSPLRATSLPQIGELFVEWEASQGGS